MAFKTEEGEPQYGAPNNQGLKMEEDDDGYDMTFKTEGDESQYDPSNDQGLKMEDDDIEEIPRSNNFDGPDPYTVIPFPSLVSQAFEAYSKNQFSIPRKLDPLPQWLFRGDNMKYFHHYLKFTARLLVPHDCSENPFKHILPQIPLSPPPPVFFFFC